MKALKGLSVALTAVVLLAGIALALIYTDYQRFLDAPLAVPKPPGVEFSVPPGASVRTLARELEARGVWGESRYLPASWYWQFYARQSGQAQKIKTGDYRIEPGATPRTLLSKLVQGRVIQHALTIVEGWTFRQLLEAVAAHPKLTHTLLGLSDSEVMARLDHPDEHPEGRFFPDTYHFPNHTSDVDFLKRAYQAMQRRLTEAWQQRPSESPLKTPYEALILASIIEKETSAAEERREIAGVFSRRLRKGMRLQTDPTVIYGLGAKFDGNIRRADLAADTPYNTYTRTGLPPTPIALPGAESIAAAVNPAPGENLYFVATGDGRHVFSRTLEEHTRAVRKYQLR